MPFKYSIGVDNMWEVEGIKISLKQKYYILTYAILNKTDFGRGFLLV